MTAMPTTEAQRLKDFESYRTTLERAVALESEAAQRMGEAATSGDVRLLNNLFDEMTLRVEQLDQLRKRMTHRDRLIARFSVEVPQEGVVSLIIPSGVSRMSLLEQGDSAVRESHGRGSVWGPVLQRWRQSREFSDAHPQSEAITIKGRIEGTEGKPAREQAAAIEGLGYEPATPWDVAVAHLAYAIATGGNLFGWRAKGESFRARTTQGVLSLGPQGLSDLDFHSSLNDGRIMMPGRVPNR